MQSFSMIVIMTPRFNYCAMGCIGLGCECNEHVMVYNAVFFCDDGHQGLIIVRWVVLDWDVNAVSIM